MFVGHYAPALALKAVRKSPSLAAGFLAVQLLDIGFFPLSYLGIEKWAANPALKGFMQAALHRIGKLPESLPGYLRPKFS